MNNSTEVVKVTKAPKTLKRTTLAKVNSSPKVEVASMTSLEIAELTGKEHKHVLRDIKLMFVSLEITESSFGLSYKDSTGRTLSAFNLPKDLTLTLVSGYSVLLRKKIVDRLLFLEDKTSSRLQAENAELKERERIASRQVARLECLQMTDALKEARTDEGKDTGFFHYSNEMDMINKIVLRCRAKEYREKNGIPENNHLRDHLGNAQMTAIEHLQKVNTVLIESGMSMEDRKAKLTKIFTKKHLPAIIEESSLRDSCIRLAS